jgi:uncharacterized protein
LSVAYLDSSALAKLYLDEDQAEQQQVLELIERCGQVASCAIAYAEVSGVFARYFHEGKLTQEDYEEQLARFSADWETVSLVGIAPELSTLAAQLMKSQRGLRAMDALHLAAALRVRTTDDLQFLTFDNHLQRTAQALMPDAFSY